VFEQRWGKGYPAIDNAGQLTGAASQCWCEAVAELLALKVEHAIWPEAMPDSLRDIATADALQYVIDPDTQQLLRSNRHAGRSQLPVRRDN
jgi:hypothetical protein